ncbi:hypothetical protein [Neorhizobium tomejilense]|uniref:hypothetical protein n=1 Tax=Neorhizobium tomejilense TaxID=2093828 RepID=UPI003ECCB505
MMRLKAFLTAIILVPTGAHAEPAVWSGEIPLDGGYDCKLANAEGIVVRGNAVLVNPNDSLTNGIVLKISIQCPSLVFEPGSELRSISALDIRIGGTSSGPILIRNTRGYNGLDASPTRDIWASRKMRNGEPGRSGTNGQDARGCLFNDRQSSTGQNGQSGQAGESGRLFVASAGANGENGGTGGDITFVSRFLAPGSTLTIISNGGAGGDGGRGGRGADGGDGGNGGNGGKGGSANDCHSASRGGNGGNGGNGGDGGDGGPGGHGGHGGNGGDALVLIQSVVPSNFVPNISTLGGVPGLGGLGGEEGRGGRSGHSGTGGAAEIGFAQNGELGINGKAGMNGLPGPVALAGKSGQVGNGSFGVYKTIKE